MEAATAPGEQPTTVEWVAVVVAIIAAGATVAVVSGFRRLGDQISAQGERLARVKGMIETLQSVMLADRRRSDQGAA